MNEMTRIYTGEKHILLWIVSILYSVGFFIFCEIQSPFYLIMALWPPVLTLFVAVIYDRFCYVAYNSESVFIHRVFFCKEIKFTDITCINYESHFHPAGEFASAKTFTWWLYYKVDESSKKRSVHINLPKPDSPKEKDSEMLFKAIKAVNQKFYVSINV